MTDYIVCHNKRNSPRMNVRVCREKCPLKEECKEYMDYLKASAEEKHALPPVEKTPFALSANCNNPV